MTRHGRRELGVGALLLLLSAAVIAACSNAGPAPAGRTAAGSRSTSDARVKSFAGQTPPDVFTDGTWVSKAGPTSLAALRGRVVYLQFAFPH